jgi:hypothetical protein
VEVVPPIPRLLQTRRPTPPVPRATICSHRVRATTHHPLGVRRIPAVIQGGICSRSGAPLEAHQPSYSRTFHCIGMAQELHKVEEVPRRVQDEVQVRNSTCHHLQALLLPRSPLICFGLKNAAGWHRRKHRRGVRRHAEVHRQWG